MRGAEYNQALGHMRRATGRRREATGDGETFAEQVAKSPRRQRIEKNLGDLTAMAGRDRAVGAARLSTAERRAAARASEAERFWEGVLDREGRRINQRRDATRVEDNGYKKGGLIKSRAKKK
jgi:hypothetical protein